MMLVYGTNKRMLVKAIKYDETANSVYIYGDLEVYNPNGFYSWEGRTLRLETSTGEGTLFILGLALVKRGEDVRLQSTLIDAGISVKWYEEITTGLTSRDMWHTSFNTSAIQEIKELDAYVFVKDMGKRHTLVLISEILNLKEGYGMKTALGYVKTANVKFIDFISYVNKYTGFKNSRILATIVRN